MNSDYLVEGKLNGDAIILQGLAKGGKRFLARKNSRLHIPFQIRSKRLFSFFLLDDLVDPQHEVDVFESKDFKMLSDSPRDLKLNDQQIAVLQELCELSTVMRVVNNPQVDGFQIYFNKNFFREPSLTDDFLSPVRNAFALF